LNSNVDAVLLVGFGGPEAADEVLPFLENVLRGRNVPRKRMLEVAEHYYHFGGKSPINDQMRALRAALESELEAHGPRLPVYWGNRNWRPMLEQTIAEMAANGVRRALAFVPAAYSSYSSCRQYLEDLERARCAAGAGGLQIEKIRVFFNHPLFIAANAARLREAAERLPPNQRSSARLVFTAHSLPEAMASRCPYQAQLLETCRLAVAEAGLEHLEWRLVYQSRSGRPEDPWLEPDVLDHLRALRTQGEQPVLLMPIGFLSDHLEVLYDLDVEAAALCQDLGLQLVRAATVGTHPKQIAMIRELIVERAGDAPGRPCLGGMPAGNDFCPDDCCPAPAGRPSPKVADA
jgi:ferrochelatase